MVGAGAAVVTGLDGGMVWGVGCGLRGDGGVSTAETKHVRNVKGHILDERRGTELQVIPRSLGGV